MLTVAMEPDWLVWLRSRVADLGSAQKAADEIGISRTAVSLLLAGKYTASTDKVAAKITSLISAEAVWCPHLARSLDAHACQALSQSAMPQSDPAALRQWIACKSCPNRGVRA